jgi:hypothetical protein
MHKIGVLFDIDGLGGGFYGGAAYGLLFDRVGRALFRNVALFDGDTNETLSGEGRVYCIAVQSANQATCDEIERALATVGDAGLQPSNRRFLHTGPILDSEPLVYAGRIDQRGMLLECDTPWIITAWNRSPDQAS